MSSSRTNIAEAAASPFSQSLLVQLQAAATAKFLEGPKSENATIGQSQVSSKQKLAFE